MHLDDHPSVVGEAKPRDEPDAGFVEEALAHFTEGRAHRCQRRAHRFGVAGGQQVGLQV